MNEVKLTPMMRQYKDVKSGIPDDALLLFRMGDFYEMFFEDAVKGSRLLDITLTKRQGLPMCGIPYHALDNYLPKIINAGVKVAIAEQVEDPKQAKGIVKREVTRIITPGTIVDSSILAPNQSNFLVSVAFNKKKYGVACLDISTGNFQITEITSFDALEDELARLNTRECLVSESLLKEWENDGIKPLIGTSIVWSSIEDWNFAFDIASDFLKQQFSVATLDGFGCRELDVAVSAAGAALYYAVENLRQDAGHINSLKTYHTDEFMILDSASRRNLEIVESIRADSKEQTLLKVLDDTRTSMGGRLLREWLLRPLYNKLEINKRLDSVDDFRYEPLTLAELQEMLSVVRDLERIIGRLNIGNANARDLNALSGSLGIIPDLKNILSTYSAVLVSEYNSKINLFPVLTDLITEAIVDEPPLTITDGGLIKDGYSKELDVFRKASSEGKSWIAALQAKEQERTGVKSLKIRYNKVFGYYIELTKSNLNSVPEDYIRKQTLVNAERFITPELKEVESKVIGSDDKAKALEYELFQEIRNKCVEFTNTIRESASAIAAVDVLSSLAEVARKNNYKRPTVTESDKIKISAGRHPVLDVTLHDEQFVPNDTYIDNRENNIIIITGPNMAGKSTYIRQVALLVLMTQMGSFIPAEEAEIGIVDRIFTRVGASDDISRGQSTFMMEMVETANILNHATNKSLIILDEIGRGTSTFDGLSIAWAVAEFIHDTPSSKAKTLFATHYHELTELALTCKGVKNFNVAVREYGDKVVFLRQIIPGAADKSYGIYVAKLAGLPEKVLGRAKEILDNLENNAITEGQPTLAEHKKTGRRKKKQIKDPKQMMLFD
ncbi:MAG: DNA mismatch repair protein MutS [bacterium]|nr:DNA mismatch repair protein MutS [bacterium]